MPPCLLRAARRRSGRADEGRTPVRGVPQPLVRSALSWAGSRPEAPVSFGSPGILRSASPAQRRSGCAVGGSRFSGDPCLMWCRSGPMEQASSAPVRADGKRVRKPVRAHPARNGDVPGEAKETCTASAACSASACYAFASRRVAGGRGCGEGVGTGGREGRTLLSETETFLLGPVGRRGETLANFFQDLFGECQWEVQEELADMLKRCIGLE